MKARDIQLRGVRDRFLVNCSKNSDCILRAMSVPNVTVWLCISVHCALSGDEEGSVADFTPLPEPEDHRIKFVDRLSWTFLQLIILAVAKSTASATHSV